MSAATTARAYLELARISNAPTVVSNALAGTALAAFAHGGAPDTMPRAAACSAIALVCFYSAGMAMNDLLDRAIDARERPARPIPSGRVSPAGAMAFVASLIGAGLALLLPNGVAAAGAGLALVALIGLYNALHTHSRWSVLIMGGCRAMAIVTAGLAFGVPPTLIPIVGPAALLAIFVAGFSLVARREAAFSTEAPDWVCGGCAYPVSRAAGRCPECGRGLDPDRAGDIVRPSDAPVRRRFRVAPFIGIVPLLGLVFVPVPALVRTPSDTESIALDLGLLVVAAFMLAWSAAAARLIERTPPRIGPAILMWIAAICLIDAYLALLARSIPLALGCIACFLACRALQRRIAGT
jgi:4-hydroxybenzoate polyprenyltransferase